MKNKRILRFALAVLMTFFSISTISVASANDVDFVAETETVKSMGLADEVDLLEKNGLLNSDVTLNQENVENEISTEEQIAGFNQQFEKRRNDIKNTDREKSEDFQALYDEYAKKNSIEKSDIFEVKGDEPESESVDPEMNIAGVETRAISYYSGTSIPTYTSVTGRSVYDSETLDDGYVAYTYRLVDDEYTEYLSYLINYCGWELYDYVANDADLTISSYLLKDNNLIGVVADCYYGYVTVLFKKSTTVNPTSVSLDISKRTMIVGNQYTLEATVYPSNATNKSVTWSSSNSSVASVSSSGVVTAKAAGSATITAKTSNGKTATCTITVKSLVLAYYPDTKIPTYTCITGVSQVDAGVNDGIRMYFYDLDVEFHTDYEAYLVNKGGWTLLEEELSSDSNIFSAAYGKGEEVVVVMAVFSEGLTCIAFEEPVTTVSVSGVSLNTTSSNMTVGDTMTLTATVSPSNATNKNVTWSSSNASVATVSSSGVVTAKSVGTATITVKTTDGNKTATCTVTVKAKEVLVTKVTLNKESITLRVGETETLVATIAPTNATNKNVTWSSSDDSVVSVSSTGVIAAKEVGVATITVTTADGEYTATCDVTVKTNSPLLSVESVYAQKGKTVEVEIELMNNPGIAAVGFNVNYNKDAMTLKSAELGEIFTGDLECNIEAVPFVFNVYSGTSNKTNDGTLVVLQFEIKEDCPVGEYDIEIGNIECLNLDELLVNLEWEDGVITVRDCLPGDVTGDGTVNRSDLLRLAKHFSGFEVEIDMAASDVTGDGKVNRSDLLRLAKYFSGFDVVLGK